MAVTIKRVMLWQTEIRNEPGALSAVLEPLAQAGLDLHAVMKRCIPGSRGRATVEILPGSGRKATALARAAGFSQSPTEALLVEGINRPGLAYAVANSIAWAGISLRFLSAQIAGEQYSALLGFRTLAERRKGASLIRRVANDADGAASGEAASQ
jgi:prephenate dehydratase